MKYSQKHSIALIGLLSILMSAVSACNSSDVTTVAASANPIDGTFKATTWTCNSTNLMTTATTAGISLMYQVISSAVGSQINTFSSGCVQTTAETYTYSGSTVSITDGATTCSSTCSGAECTAAAATNTQSTYTYSLSGTTLTLTRTLTAANISTTPLC
jgi:hypothetical protein